MQQSRSKQPIKRRQPKTKDHRKYHIISGICVSALCVNAICGIAFSMTAPKASAYNPTEFSTTPNAATIVHVAQTPTDPASDAQPASDDPSTDTTNVSADETSMQTSDNVSDADAIDSQSDIETYDVSYSASDFRRLGIVSDGDNTYTWYSENIRSGGGLTELNNNGRHVTDDGYVVDADGYIAVAQPNTTNPDIGAVVDTPFGKGRIYDCNPYGDSYDIYVSW